MTHTARVARLAALAGLAALAVALAGCGQKGPLYLPDEGARDIVTRPGPAAEGEKSSAPDTPQTADQPQEPASPAPEVTAPDKDKKNQGSTPQR